MNKKSLWITLAIVFSIVGAAFGIMYQLGNHTINSLSSSDETASTNVQETESPVLDPSVSPIQPSLTPSARPSSTPTLRPSTRPSPTPTPRPLIDYYVQSTSQILLPENTSNVTEYLETQTHPKMRLEVDFAVNNAVVGDAVEMKIYEDGVDRQTQTRIVSSTTNFHFAEVYYAISRTPGTHTVRFVYNERRTITEGNYNNNEHTFTFRILAETVPPTFSIRGPEIINGQTCLTWENLHDNVSVYTDVWAKWKMDSGSWSNPASGTTWGCVTGISGSSHTYYVHAEDANGNMLEKSQTFTIN